MKKVITHDRIIFPAIWLNAVVIALLGFEGLHDNPWLLGLDYFITVFFIIEITVKIVVDGPRTFFASGWNVFDFVIILLGSTSLLSLVVTSPNLNFFLVFRLLRLLKLFLFLKSVPRLHVLMRSIGRAFRASFFVMVALAMYVFILSVLNCHLFSEMSPEYFGDPVRSAWSMFKALTVEGWTDIPDSICSLHPGLSPWIRLYFMFLVVSTGMLGFSIVNAIFVDSFLADDNQALIKKIDTLEKKIDVLLAEKEQRDGGGEK